MGNLITGKAGKALAIICDRCGERQSQGEDLKIQYAVEFLGTEVIYHDYIPDTSTPADDPEECDEWFAEARAARHVADPNDYYCEKNDYDD